MGTCDRKNPCGPEVWLPAVGFEGRYSVFNHGRVSSHIFEPGRIRATPCSKAGRPRLTFSVGGVVHYRMVHTLVAEAFIGPRPEGMQIRHLNGDPTDNHLSNLAYGTHSENMLDKVVHGTHHEVNKTHCPSGHAYDDLNTYTTPSTGKRKCRTCNRERARLIKARLRAAA